MDIIKIENNKEIKTEFIKCEVEDGSEENYSNGGIH